MKNKTVYIMSGLPGSGKTTYVRRNLPGAFVVSADLFFSSGGSYHFDASLLGAAHDVCRNKFHSHITTKCTEIVVDNTNLIWSDCAWYVYRALAAGYEVVVVQLRCSVREASNRNIHGVGMDHLQRMAGRVFVIPTHILDNPSVRVDTLDSYCDSLRPTEKIT